MSGELVNYEHLPNLLNSYLIKFRKVYQLWQLQIDDFAADH